MTIIYNKRVIQSFRSKRWYWNFLQPSGRVISDYEFHDCHLLSCVIMSSEDPNKRTVLEKCKFFNCQTTGIKIYRAIVRDTVVDGLKTNGVFHTWGAAFEHVTLRGRIGQIMLSGYVTFSKKKEALA